MAARQLIVNADDLGLSLETNRGIFTAHAQGIVTSASVMVRAPAAAAAADESRQHPRLGLGLHLDLGEWAFRDGAWVALYEVVPQGDAAAVRTETESQLAAFRRLFGRDPTHLDSHQHVHRRPPVREILIELGRRLGVPVRHETDGVRYCGDFYGQDAKGKSYRALIAAEALVTLVEGLKSGTTELACHPGFDTRLDSMYVSERADEVAALCDPRVRAAIERLGIELVSFAARGR